MTEIEVNAQSASRAFFYNEANGTAYFIRKDDVERRIKASPVTVGIVDGKWRFFPERSSAHKAIMQALSE